jgi:hypothetical protein
MPAFERAPADAAAHKQFALGLVHVFYSWAGYRQRLCGVFMVLRIEKKRTSTCVQYRLVFFHLHIKKAELATRFRFEYSSLGPSIYKNTEEVTFGIKEMMIADWEDA